MREVVADRAGDPEGVLLCRTEIAMQPSGRTDLLRARLYPALDQIGSWHLPKYSAFPASPKPSRHSEPLPTSAYHTRRRWLQSEQCCNTDAGSLDQHTLFLAENCRAKSYLVLSAMQYGKLAGHVMKKCIQARYCNTALASGGCLTMITWPLDVLIIPSSPWSR